MLESGQLSRLWSQWQTKPVVGCLGDSQEPLQIGTVAAVFVILGSAAGFSLVLLVAEIGIRWEKYQMKDDAEGQNVGMVDKAEKYMLQKLFAGRFYVLSVRKGQFQRNWQKTIHITDKYIHTHTSIEINFVLHLQSHYYQYIEC